MDVRRVFLSRLAAEFTHSRHQTEQRVYSEHDEVVVLRVLAADSTAHVEVGVTETADGWHFTWGDGQSAPVDHMRAAAEQISASLVSHVA